MTNAKPVPDEQSDRVPRGQARIAELEAERDALREKLRIFGVHDYACIWQEQKAYCNCGLIAALNPKPTSPTQVEP